MAHENVRCTTVDQVNAHKIPVTKPIERLSALSETPDELLMAQLLVLRASRCVRRTKATKGKKPSLEHKVLFKTSGCMTVPNTAEGTNE